MFDKFDEKYTLRKETPSVSPAGRHRLARYYPRSVRKRRAQCAVSKFAGGKKPTGLFARKHLLTL